MLTQDYLRSFRRVEDGLTAITAEYGVVNNVHEDGRVILNYRQGCGPKTDPLVRECRGLVLDSKNNWDLVARSFSRFFNLGEHREEQDSFVWEDCIATEKVDGSLLTLDYYREAWHIYTRGSFGAGEVPAGGMTWRELAETALQNTLQKCTGRSKYKWRDVLDTRKTYVMELCSPYNKVVRYYPAPQVYLLSIFQGENELDWATTYIEGKLIGIWTPQEYNFADAEAVISHIEATAEGDKTFEGVVLRDKNNIRIKYKSLSYIRLHRLVGGIPITTKLILSIILTGESTEVLNYYPEFKDKFDGVYKQLNHFINEVCRLYNTIKHIESQKQFALLIKDKPYAGLFFTARKLKKDPIDLLDKFQDMLIESSYIK